MHEKNKRTQKFQVFSNYKFFSVTTAGMKQTTAATLHTSLMKRVALQDYTALGLVIVASWRFPPAMIVCLCVSRSVYLKYLERNRIYKLQQIETSQFQFLANLTHITNKSQETNA